MEHNQPTKWEGKTSTTLKGPTIDQVWSVLLNDFFELHKWLPSIDTCRKIEGIAGEPGSVRYCAGSSLAPPGEPVGWTHEKLLTVDVPARTYTFEVTDSNIGMSGYTATIKVLPASGEGGVGCTIEWSFTMNPIQGMSYEDIMASVGLILPGMGKKIEEAFAA